MTFCLSAVTRESNLGMVGRRLPTIQGLPSERGDHLYLTSRCFALDQCEAPQSLVN